MTEGELFFRLFMLGYSTGDILQAVQAKYPTNNAGLNLRLVDSWIRDGVNGCYRPGKRKGRK